MKLARNVKTVLVAIAGLVALPSAPALAGTVVASSGPSAGQYRVGAQISDTQRITLREGDSLTVLDNGGTRVLRGPGSFTLARASGQTTNSAFAALTAQRSASRARTGAVRTGETGLPPTNPSLWYVDVASQGAVCLADSQNVRFWRADTVAAADLTIAPDSGAAQTIAFQEREMLARLPADLSLSEGMSYTLTAPGATQATQVSFVFLAQVPEDPETLAQTLISNNCNQQLQQLAAATVEQG